MKYTDKTVITMLSEVSIAADNCERTDNHEWCRIWLDYIARIAKEQLPSGSGFDCGTRVILANEQKAIFQTDFHHMDDNGMYDGWTQHTVTARPVFGGISVHVSGRDRNGIKDYIAAEFHNALMEKAIARVQE